MKKLLTGFLLNLIVLIISGCAAQQSGAIMAPSVTPPLSTVSRTSTPTTAPTKTPTFTVAATITTYPTKTPAASLTANSTSSAVDLVDSVEIAPEMIWGQANGSLLLLDYSSDMDILLDLTTGTKIYIDPVDPLLTYCDHVAPNRLQIACSTEAGDTSSMLLILDHLGQVTKEYPWQDTWHILAGWLNNDDIMLLADRPPGYDPYQNLPTTLLNLTEEEEITLLPDYPDINIFEPFNNQGPIASTGTSYSPNLKLVVYELWDGEQDATVLWDRENNIEVARIPQADEAPYPQWNSAGDLVVLVGGLESQQEFEEGSKSIYRPRDSELYILSVASKAQQITHLSEIFDNTTSIYSLGWSPDGQRIAFDLRVDSSECADGCIGILDVDTGVTEIVNFPNYRVGIALEPTYSLTWSPNSRQLLMRVISLVTNEDSIIIFDVEQKLAFQVTTQARIEGWLDHP